MTYEHYRELKMQNNAKVEIFAKLAGIYESQIDLWNVIIKMEQDPNYIPWIK